MNRVIGAVFNAAILGLAAVVFGVLFGSSARAALGRHSCRALSASRSTTSWQARISRNVLTVSGFDHRVLAEIAFKD